MRRVVRKTSPLRCEVIRPCESCNGVPSRVRMIDRNWYNSRLPSIAIRRPRRALRVVGCRTTTGVRKTPNACPAPYVWLNFRGLGCSPTEWRRYAAGIEEPSERRLDERVLWDVGAEVLQRQGSEANVRGTRLFPERLDPMHRPRLLLRLDPEHSEDLETVLRCISVKVIVEETVDGLRLGGDLLHPGHPGLNLFLAVAVVVPRVRPVAVPPQVRHRRRHVQVRREERLVDDRVCDAGRAQEIEGLHRHPRLVTRLEREREVSRQDVQEAVDRRLLGPPARRALVEGRAPLPRLEEGPPPVGGSGER